MTWTTWQLIKRGAEEALKKRYFGGGTVLGSSAGAGARARVRARARVGGVLCSA